MTICQLSYNDIIPNRERAKQKIYELNAHKKELAIDKRSVNEEMRQIRAAARQSRASLSGVRSGTIGKFASYQQAAITRGKESKLSPLESAKGEIEYQLIETEKKINRLKCLRIDDEEIIEFQILRCAYCGRRVNLGEICPGCGSDRTTTELN